MTNKEAKELVSEHADLGNPWLVALGLREGKMLLQRFGFYAPDPITTKMKNPSMTGPTGSLLAFFCAGNQGRVS